MAFAVANYGTLWQAMAAVVKFEHRAVALSLGSNCSRTEIGEPHGMLRQIPRNKNPTARHGKLPEPQESP